MTYPITRYATEFSIDHSSLNSVFVLAANSACSRLSKSISALWFSKRFMHARNATLQADFYRKLQISYDVLPSYIQEQLTPQKMQSLTRKYTVIHVRNTLTQNPHTMQQLYDTLNLVRRTERQKEWVSSYLLAHIVSISEIGNLLYVHNAASNFHAVLPNMPFTSWLLILQNPQNADLFSLQFKNALHTFNLDFEGKVLCASSILNVYSKARKRQAGCIINHLTKTDCLDILNTLANKPEGKKAVLAAKGLERLQKMYLDTLDSKTDPCRTSDPSLRAKLQEILKILEEVPAILPSLALETSDSSTSSLESASPSDVPRLDPTHAPEEPDHKQKPPESMDKCCRIA